MGTLKKKTRVSGGVREWAARYAKILGGSNKNVTSWETRTKGDAGTVGEKRKNGLCTNLT